jgi:hypothetical protein
VNTVGVFPKREQRLVISKDYPGSRSVYRDIVVMNAIVYGQKIFESTVALLDVVK